MTLLDQVIDLALSNHSTCFPLDSFCTFYKVVCKHVIFLCSQVSYGCIQKDLYSCVDSAQEDRATPVTKVGDNGLELTYRQLEVTLAAYLNVHPDKVGTFRSRMKQLQRLEFPVGVNIGRGVRMTYTAEHLLQLAVAFEIIGTGLAAKAATDLVTSYWERFQAAFGRAHSRTGYSQGFETFVCVAGQPPVVSETDDDRIVSVHDLTSLTEEVLCYPKPDAPSRAGMQILRADYLLERLNRIARDTGQVLHPKWSPEYREWSRKRNEDQQFWDYADGGPPVPF